MLQVRVAQVLAEVTGRKLLATRPLGRQVRERVIVAIQNAPHEAIVKLDFEGVEFIDYSGADELVVMLMNRIVNNEMGSRYLVVTNLLDWHRENVLVALDRSKKHAILELRSNELILLGKLKPMLVDVLKTVYNQGVQTARGLADATGNEINLASTKLSQLFQQRLIVRNEELLPEGGRQYIYEPIVPMPVIIQN